MTQGELQTENNNAQRDNWIASEKLNCRRIAMASALTIKMDGGCDLIPEADKIYNWLIQDLNP